MLKKKIQPQEKHDRGNKLGDNHSHYKGILQRAPLNTELSQGPDFHT